MNICVIPARGGSKRIPRKNIRAFCGKPMIGWSIDAAVSSSLFDRVIVSTDDEEVRDLAIELGADIPFVRPAELADDHAVLNDVMSHAVKWCSQNHPEIQYACCLLATAPFVTKADLSEGLARIKKSDAAYTVSICRYNFPVQRSVRVSDDGRLEMLHPEHRYTRSQDLVKSSTMQDSSIGEQKRRGSRRSCFSMANRPRSSSKTAECRTLIPWRTGPRPN